MADLETLVSGIDYKVHQLIERLQILQQENEQKKNEIRELNKINENQTQVIETLNQKINHLKTTRNVEFNEGTVEAKATINELLREIDSCIGLLNR
ncbi:MAG: hypothetical protein D4R67_08495 [Bacteroidetes bacterium]|nr:MAG: hypothetical protein D4R67_08495 [Bacteroidota bacterium]